ncbi:uncharacterized protein LOC127862522 isoform X2 [Dreissena polymorpha]|uniref:uncharacterized protein LOC127862522 isoform X2 n=1 Tax=Dreissena polymorpha TaxID=45954 RepID=UPI0022643BE2|nr:uncharacterized protein LOC127862522 isoform X2 [Dreissena polymorpha]
MNSPAYAASLVDYSWSITTYRLDELERRFTFPRVIRLAEGYCSDIEAEGFSKDDIIAVDNKLVLHKVGAFFTDRTSPITQTNDESDFSYVRLSDEILVPLNYKGKVKILNAGKKYTTVRDLAEEFPRFAKACQNFSAYGADHKRFDVQAGTTVELERIVPGRNGQPDELVIQFQAEGKPVFAKISSATKTVFRAQPDITEYTIREVIDRFKLPQVVTFIDDEIRRVYTQDLIEGIENMRKITKTLQLNRLVTQNVLVGHYKPVEGLDTGDSERFRKRTLVVIPLDHPEIREIQVHALEDDAEISAIYEKVFNVYNISSSHEVVDAIYVEYFKEAPSTMFIRVDSPTSNTERVTSEVLPLIPPRPSLSPGFKRHNFAGNKPLEEKELDDYEEMSPTPMSKGASDSNRKPPKRADTTITSEAHNPKDAYEDPEPLPQVHRRPRINNPAGETSSSPPLLPPRLNQGRSREPSQERSREPSPRAHRKPVPDGYLKMTGGENPHIDQDGYEEIEEKFTPPPATPKIIVQTDSDDYLEPMSHRKEQNSPVHYVNSSPTFDFSFDLATTYSSPLPALPIRTKSKKGGIFRSWNRNKKNSVKSPSQPKETRSKKPEPNTELDTKELKDDYNDIGDLELYPEVKVSSTKLPPKTAVVKPMTSASTGDFLSPASADQKCFKQLSCDELVKRLRQCALLELAQMCENDRLDGSFFESLDDHTLTTVFNLKSVNLLKFKKMRDSNWLPSDN